MALDFPSSPVNGQVYDNFIYDAAKGTWKSLSSGASPNYLVNPTITNAVITATADTPSTIPLTVNGAASQSANLQEWKNSAGIVLSDIDAAGKGNFEAGSNALNIKASSTVNHGYLAFYTENTTPTTRTGYFGFGSNGTTTMTIANERSAGTISLNASYVRMPNQPSFRAQRTTHVTATGVIIFQNVYHNDGSAYNSTNGRFTAPVAGRYLVNFSTLLYEMGTASNVYVRVNGSDVAFAGTYGQFTGSYAGQGFATVLSLSVNDYVEWYFVDNGANLHSGYTHASAHLLG